MLWLKLESGDLALRALKAFCKQLTFFLILSVCFRIVNLLLTVIPRYSYVSTMDICSNYPSYFVHLSLAFANFVSSSIMAHFFLFRYSRHVLPCSSILATKSFILLWSVGVSEYGAKRYTAKLSALIKL